MFTGRSPRPSERLSRSRVHQVVTDDGPVVLDTEARTLRYGSGRKAEVQPAGSAVTVRVDVGAGSRVSGGRVAAFGALGLVARKRDTSYLIVEGPAFIWEAPIPARRIDEARAFATLYEQWRRSS